MRNVWPVLLLGCLGACSPTLPPPSVAPPPKEAKTTAQANLLLFPEANSESLLGRAVQVTEDGGWTIADSRAPGCEVSVVHEKASFQHGILDAGRWARVGSSP